MDSHLTESDLKKSNTVRLSNSPILIVGGGIAGVSCLQQLALSCPQKEVILVSASPLVTVSTNVKILTKTLTQFDVEERKMEWLSTVHPRVKVLHDKVTSFDPKSYCIFLASGASINYSRLCICTGAHPKGLPGVKGAATNPNVLGVRDAATANELRRRVTNARCILIAGNGGIASEVAYGLHGVNVIWAIRDNHINAAFVDPGAATYLEENLRKKCVSKDKHEEVSGEAETENVSNYTEEVDAEAKWKIKRIDITKENSMSDSEILGSALGPEWQTHFPLHGAANESSIRIEYGCEVSRVLTPEEVKSESIICSEPFSNIKCQEDRDKAGSSVLKTELKWPVYVLLTNGKCLGCDLIVAATGVVPNSSPFLNVTGGPTSCPEDGNGLLVDLRMRTIADGVFAAGDVCTAAWPNKSKHWIQMRLWTQARLMGFHAGRCIAASLNREKLAQEKGKHTSVNKGVVYEGLPLKQCDEGNNSLLTEGAPCADTADSSKLPTVINVHWKEDDYDVIEEDDERMYDFCFELFSHVTKFFGRRTILLGLFNGQGLDKDYEALVRVSEGEFVKAILGRDGRLAGAVLIGETDLEETFENLILSGLDLSSFGEDLLHPGVDIEDFFD